MTTIYVDADACPVRDEVYRVAERLRLAVLVVHNGSRPIRPPGGALIRVVTVAEGPDAADDWIAGRVTAADVCVTQDVPLAARCLALGARALAANGRVWSGDNIGSALASRAIGEHLRASGQHTGGPSALSRADRSRFLGALDTVAQAAMRVTARVWFAEDAAVAEVGEGLLDRTLPKARWTHAGHFGATLWLLERHSVEQLAERLPGVIRLYNQAVGGVNSETEGYHETITQASLRAAADFGFAELGLAGRCNRLLGSRLGRPAWLEEYWSRERLFSREARLGWVAPDVRPLPF